MQVFVDDAMGDMSCRNVGACALAMPTLVVEEDISAKSTEKFCFVHPTQKKRFIQADIPGTQCSNNPLVRWRTASGDQCGSNGAILLTEFTLQCMQGAEKGFEGSAFEGPGRRSGFRRRKGIETAGLIDLFRFVRENDGVTIERQAQFVDSALIMVSFGFAATPLGCAGTTE